MVAVRVAVMAAVSAVARILASGGVRRRAASATSVPMPAVRTTRTAVVAPVVALGVAERAVDQGVLLGRG